MKMNIFKKFFTTITSSFTRAISNIYLSILPRKAYLRFMRKNDTAGIFKDISDEVLLQSRAAVRIHTIIKTAIMAVGTFLGYTIWKKCHV